MIFSYVSLAAVAITISLVMVSGHQLVGATDTDASSRMVNLTISSTSINRTQVMLPPQIVAYTQIHISNTLSVAVPGPFEQLVHVDSSKLFPNEAPNLQNIEFFDVHGNVIPSWMESGNSYASKDTVYWLKLANGIAPSSTVAVYMGFAPTKVNLLNNLTTGEAPQLSQVYGQYDNGKNIFRYYQRFGGLESLPSGWSAIDSTGNVSSSSACQPAFSPDHASISSNSTLSCGIYADSDVLRTSDYPLVVDMFGSMYSIGQGNYSQMGYYTDAPAISSELAGRGATASYALKVPGYIPGSGSPTGIRLVNNGPEYQTDYVDSNSNKVYSIYVSNFHSATLMTGYISQYTSDKLGQGSFAELAITTHGSGSQQFPARIYWLDSRAYPPQGAMPMVSLGATYYKSTTALQCVPSKIILGSSVRCTATVSGYSPNQANPLSTQVYPNGTITWSGDEQRAFSPSFVCKLANGTCSVVFAPTNVLATSVVAAYSGDVFNDRGSTVYSLGIDRAHTVMSAFCLPSPVPANSTTTCNAVIRGIAPSGPVIFTTSSPTGSFTPLGGQCVISVWGCSIGYSDTTGGPANITASYTGDVSNMPASAGTTLTITGSTNVPEFPFSTLSLVAAISSMVAILAVVRARRPEEN